MSRQEVVQSTLKLAGAVDRIEGESGFDVMKRVPIAHIPALFSSESPRYSYRYISLYLAVAEVSLPGDFAEFGVYTGRCARFLQNLVATGRTLHLLDSFEGLPEAWTGQWKKGYFDLGGRIPRFDPRVTRIHRGWFKDTVPAFASTLSKPLSLIHLDADLYSSTMDALEGLNNQIIPGTILLFDEYVFRKTEEEHKAVIDWATKYNRDFQYLWRSKWIQVAVKITR